MPQSAYWGRYQASASVMMALFKMSAAWFQLSMLILSQDVRFRCVTAANESQDFGEENTNSSFSSDESCWLKGENGTRQSCSQWEYEEQEEMFTVNMMWDLVCDREWLNTWAQFSFMCGVFSGNLIGGLLAERVGRKPVLVTSVLLQPLASVVVAVVPWYSLFVLSRFLLGLCLGSTIVISFMLGGELAIGPLRAEITILHQVPFGIGQTLLPLLGYFLRDWRELQVALSLCCLIFIPYICLVEESPRWLETTGRLKQAERVKQVIRSRNGLPIAGLLEMCPMTEKHQVEIVKAENCRLNDKNVTDPRLSISSVLGSTPLRYRCLAVWLAWYCAGLSFFALNAYQVKLGGDLYVNVGVGGLVGGIPGNICTIFLVRKFGKKKVMVIAHAFVALLALLIPIYDVGETPWDWARRIPALLTLIAMSVAYPSLFLTSGELIPVTARGSVMTGANLAARLGNTIAPLVGPTAEFHRWYPLCVVAAGPIITILLMSTLPDTCESSQPVKIKDMEAHIRDRKNHRESEKTRTSTKEEDKIYKPVQNQSC